MIRFLSKKIERIKKENLKDYFNLLLSIYNADLNFERDYNLYSSQIFQINSLIDLFKFAENEDDLVKKMQTFINYTKELKLCNDEIDRLKNY